MGENLMEEGAMLMLFGMGTVVVFLTLLVAVTTAMSALLGRLPQAPVIDVDSAASGRADNAMDPTLVAVISAAIHRHRTGKDAKDSE